MGWKDKHMDWKRAEVNLGPQDMLAGLISPYVDEGGSDTFAAGALLVDPILLNTVQPKEVQRTLQTKADGVTDETGLILTSATADFVTAGVLAGDRVSIGALGERNVASVTDLNTLVIDATVTASQSSQTYYVKRRTGMVGMAFLAAGARLRFPWRIPAQVDTTEELGIKLSWVSDSITAADDLHWIVKVLPVAAGEAFHPQSLAALDTAIVAQTIGGTTPMLLRDTSRGILAATRIEKGDILFLDLELDVADVDVASTENVWLMGATIDYWPDQMRD